MRISRARESYLGKIANTFNNKKTNIIMPAPLKMQTPMTSTTMMEKRE